jgi:hypothetical protein
MSVMKREALVGFPCWSVSETEIVAVFLALVSAT